MKERKQGAEEMLGINRLLQMAILYEKDIGEPLCKVESRMSAISRAQKMAKRKYYQDIVIPNQDLNILLGISDTPNVGELISKYFEMSIEAQKRSLPQEQSLHKLPALTISSNVHSTTLICP